MHGDNDQTLSKDCQEHVEAEANHAAGRLLFLRNRFTEEARSSELCFRSVKTLHKRYGNTLSTTLYRYVESVGDEIPIVGVISCHPHRTPHDFDPRKPTKYFIQSASFQARFSKIVEAEVFAEMKKYCGNQRGGLLGKTEMILDDDNGNSHRFYFETFFNSYDALTLGIYLAPEKTMIAVG